MSLNFTGQTTRRRVNLGNRGATSGGFLTALKQDRLQRERMRNETAMATVIQKHVRGTISRIQTFTELSDNWDTNPDIVRWSLFFPYLVSTQPHSRSVRQLAIVESVYSSLPGGQKRIVLETLLKSVEMLQTVGAATEISDMDIMIMVSIFRIFQLDITSNDQLLCLLDLDIDPLMQIIINNSSLHPLFINCIPHLALNASFQALLPLVGLLNSQPLYFQALTDTGLLLAPLLLTKLTEHEISLLTTTQTISLLTLFSHSYSNRYLLFNNTSQIRSFASLLLSAPIVNYAPDLNPLVKICEQGFFKMVLQVIDVPTFSLFTYALLKFSANVLDQNECQLFHSNMAITLITGGVDFNFISRARNQILISLPPIEKYTELVASFTSLKQFWIEIYVQNELLSIILNMSSDSQFFKRSDLSLDQYKDYFTFIKSTLVMAIIGHDKDYKTNERDLFQDVLKSSMKILNSIHLREYQMKILPNDFWDLKFKPTKDTILKACTIITDINENDDDIQKNYSIFNLSRRNYNHNLSTFIYLLNYIPFMLPFEIRANLFHEFINLDKSDNHPFGFRSSIEGVVNRGNIFIESFNEFGKLPGNDFKKPLSVQFSNEFGEREAGIDGGGLTKELLTSIIESILPTSENRKKNSNYQFFEIGEGELYPNNEMFFKYRYNKLINGINLNEEYKNYLNMIKFIGMVIGKCIYENVLIDISFTNFFLRRWLQSTTTTNNNKYSFQDLSEINIDFYKNLNNILKIEDDDEMSELGLTFSVTDKFILDDGVTLKYVEVDLIPNGSNTPVTISNKFQFILILTKFKLETQSNNFSIAFMEGLNSIIKDYQLKLFDSFELQRLISGGERGIDIDDLFENVELGGFLPHDQTIKDLYEILKEFDNESRGKFLKFVTSCPKQPLLGFKELTPKFGIRNAGRSDLIRLPTASTCVNLLKIPDYQNKEILKYKLIKSINSKSGFDLS